MSESFEQPCTVDIPPMPNLDKLPLVKGRAVDGADTNLRDDAIYAERIDDRTMRIQIHITDVASRVPFGHPLSSRLHEYGVTREFSLSAERECPCITYTCVINADGEILEEDFFRSKIQAEVMTPAQFRECDDYDVYLDAAEYIQIAIYGKGFKNRHRHKSIIPNFNSLVNWRAGVLASEHTPTDEIAAVFKTFGAFSVDPKQHAGAGRPLAVFSGPLVRRFDLLTHQGFDLAFDPNLMPGDARIQALREEMAKEIDTSMRAHLRKRTSRRLSEEDADFNTMDRDLLQRIARSVDNGVAQYYLPRNIAAFFDACEAQEKGPSGGINLHDCADKFVFLYLLMGQRHPYIQKVLSHIYAKTGLAVGAANFAGKTMPDTLEYHRLRGKRDHLDQLAALDELLRGPAQELEPGQHIIFLRPTIGPRTVSILSRNNLLFKGWKIASREGQHFMDVPEADTWHPKHALAAVNRVIRASNERLWPGLPEYLESPIVIVGANNQPDPSLFTQTPLRAS